MTCATVFSLMPLRSQYLEFVNQTSNSFAPLLELQDMQHKAIFLLVMIRSSLTMCSHEGFEFRVPHDPNVIPQ